VATGFWARVRRYYLAGLLVLAPTALTLWFAWKFFTFFDGILGDQLRARGISVFGLGFVLLNLLLLPLGWLTTTFWESGCFSSGMASCTARRVEHWPLLMHSHLVGKNRIPIGCRETRN